MKLDNFKKFGIICSLLLLSNCAFANIGNDAKLQYNRGIDYYQLGQYSQAAESFKKAVDLDPNYIDAYYNLGTLMEYLKRDEDALNAFKQIILRKPDDYEAVYKAAEISNRVGQSDKALMYLTLIPQDSLYAQKANALAHSIETNIEATKQKENEQTSTNTQETNQKPQPEEVVTTQNNVTREPEKIENNETQVSTIINYSNISSPTGVVTDNEGNLFVAGFSDNTIYKIGSDNKKIVYIKSPKIDGPIGLAIDKSGNIYIANYNKNNVLKVNAGGEISEVLTDIKNPYCMHITESYLYISSQGSNSVVKYRLP